MSPRQRLSAEQMIDLLGLKPLPGEGGFFRETYRSADRLAGAALPGRYGASDERVVSTCIYYLLTADTYSALHRLRADEVYHFYTGDPVCLTLLDGEGRLSSVTLGSDLSNGQIHQFVVPAGVWQGSRLHASGQWALMGTTVAPGFEFADCEFADQRLLDRYPAAADCLHGLLADK